MILVYVMLMHYVIIIVTINSNRMTIEQNMIQYYQYYQEKKNYVFYFNYNCLLY